MVWKTLAFQLPDTIWNGSELLYDVAVLADPPYIGLSLLDNGRVNFTILSRIIPFLCRIERNGPVVFIGNPLIICKCISHISGYMTYIG